MTTYRYDPHLDPALQLGDGVAAAEVERILERGLSATSIEDAKRALRALRDRRGPALAWAGKDERARFEVPSVSLHVHERVDPPTIIEALRSRASSPAPQPALFGTAPAPAPALPLEAYRHGRWRNRLIAGDSLVVMSSLLEREGMQGRVQMVYFDPPYGIGYGSNFQPFVHARDVKERDADLTHEPETLRAFRDTWELGVHSYLSYLRDRARLAWELLRPTGSLFLQIGEANLHLARQVLSEVFGEDNFCSLVSFRKKTMPLGSRFFEPVCDYLLWYARDRARVTSRPLFTRQRVEGNKLYRWVELPGGARRRMTPDEVRSHALLPRGARPYRLVSMLPAQYRENQDFAFELDGRRYPPPKGSCWKTTREGMRRLAAARRLQPAGEGLQYVLFADDYPVSRVTALWSDATGPSEKRYVVQTNERVVARCLLAATDPGDLVLDPTAGSGTTAVVAERWGRRWITCDTSRVAITLAKQRLMTGGFPWYALARPERGVAGGFVYKTASHVTLRSVANNPELRPGMTPDEIDAAVSRHGDREVLVDQPETVRDRLRVTGPFTVEAVPAPVVRALAADDPPGADDDAIAREGETRRQEEWREELLRAGIRGRRGETLRFARVEPLAGGDQLHADAALVEETALGPLSGARVVISFGPEHAPLPREQVARAWAEARALTPPPALVLFAAFELDPAAASDIAGLAPAGAELTPLTAKMNGDLVTSDLKRRRAGSESFWLVGQPDIELRPAPAGAGLWEVELRGFDYFNPRTGAIESGDARRVAMWILDPDYDGRSVHARQVFFPMAGPRDGWARLAKSLKGQLDRERIEAFRGVVSRPFTPGARVAVKLVDDRGVESLVVREPGG